MRTASIRTIVERQLQWWSRSNDKCLLRTFPPSGANGSAGEYPPNDTLPVKLVDMGTALMPGLAGAGFEDNGHSIWAHPCASCAAELHIPPLDRQHPLWQRLISEFKPILAGWSWDTYLPGPTIMPGPLDMVSACLGPQTLACELYTDPDQVLRCAREAAALFVEAMKIQLDMLRAAGLVEGVADWMGIWMPGDGLCFSEDFSALCGESHVRRFFLEADAMVTSELDSAFLHLHSGALPGLPAILDMPGLKALEISNDPNGPGLPQLTAAARQVQTRGMPVQMSNWEHPLTMDEIRYILSEVPPRGLKLTLQARSRDHAWRMYDLVRSM